MTMPYTSPPAEALPTAHPASTTDDRSTLSSFLRSHPWSVALWGLSLLGWAAFILFPSQLEDVQAENGLVEWAGTLAFLTACVLFWISAWRERGDRARRIMSGFLGLVFFVAFMEEVSWGQQVFKWNTPSAFDANIQNETNLHNFAIGVDQQQVFTAGILFLTVVLPLWYRWGRRNRWIDRLGFPIVSMGVAAWVAATLIIANVAERLMGVVARPGLREYMEALWGVAAILVSLAAFRRSSQPATTIGPEAARADTTT